MGEEPPNSAANRAAVRTYSLRELLAEVEEERQLSDFAREAVDQEEISKLFHRKRRKGKKRSGGA